MKKKMLFVCTVICFLVVVKSLTAANGKAKPERPWRASDGIVLGLLRAPGALVISISNAGNRPALINARFSDGGATPEITLHITKDDSRFIHSSVGMPSPLLHEHYVTLLPSRSIGAVYDDRVLSVMYQLNAGCYRIYAEYSDKAKLRPAFNKALVSNSITLCLDR